MIGILVVLAALSLSTSSATPIRRQSVYPPPNAIPPPQQSWIETYNVARAAGLIPTLAPSTGVGGAVTYAGQQPNCSWSVSKCYAPDDIHAASSGVVALGFDDGPQPASTALLAFLRSQNVRASHFVIGSHIVYFPDVFDQAVRNGAHIASHTWSHRSMTTLTDLEVLGELGWASQIIFDRTGLIPAYWRPPFGDVDERVRAIAKVFGMRTVLWNADTNDWGTPDPAAIAARLNGYYYAPKTPAGLMILEHEISERSISAFVETYSTLQNQGWRALSIPDTVGLPWYQNAATGNSTTIPGYTVGSGPARNLSLSSSSSLVRPSTTTTIPSSTQQIIAITPTTTASAPPSVTPIAIALPVVKSLGERLSISVEIPLAVLAVVGGMILWV